MASYSGSEIFEFPVENAGHTEWRKITVDRDTLNRNVNTPEMVLSVPDLIETQFPHLPADVRLHHFEHGILSNVNPRGEGNLGVSGSVKNMDAIIVLPNDAFIPILLTQLINRTPIAKMAVKYLNEKGMRSQYVFGQCHLVGYHAGLWMSLFVFRSQEFMHQFLAVDAETGEASGNTQVQYDFAKSSGASFR